MYQNQHIELKKTISMVLKKWWLLALLLLVFSLGARFICTNYIDKVYQGQTTMFIGKEKGALSDIGISFTDIQTYNQLIIDYKEIANSRLVIMATMKNLNINMDLVEFRKHLSIDIVENSRLFTVSYSSTDPVLAAKIANELAKQLTIAVSEIVTVENIRIIDKALVPIEPVSPQVNLITFLSGVIGIILGLFIIYLREIFDDSFSSQESIETELQLTVMAMIPKFKKAAKNELPLVMLNDPHSNLSESYRICRTNINYMNIDKNYQVLMVTSSAQSEGKTTTSCNLAITIAQANKKVLLIDGDLRKSRVHKLFNVPAKPGLTGAIYDKLPLSKVVQHIPDVPGLDILAAGNSAPNPAELISSDSFKKYIEEARNLYDSIIIDTPPVLSASDTAIISQLVDRVLLIVAMKETNRTIVKEAAKALERVHANIMGVILTKTATNKDNYYYGSSKPALSSFISRDVE